MLFNLSDSTLVSKALQGSEASWQKLVKRHETRLYNYCLRMSGNSSDAMDLLQEIFLSAYRHLPSWNASAPLGHWLMRIASNKIIDLHRQQQRHPWESGTGEDATDITRAPEDSSPAQHYEADERNQLIMKAMASLPMDKRLLLELKFFQQMTFEEISLITDVPVNTVKARFYSTLNNLRTFTELQHAL